MKWESSLQGGPVITRQEPENLSVKVAEAEPHSSPAGGGVSVQVFLDRDSGRSELRSHPRSEAFEPVTRIQLMASATLSI